MEQIKIKLMSSNELTQISGLKLIQHELSQLSLNQKVNYVDLLLQNNVGHILCDIMPTRNQELVDIITTILEEFTISRNFYNNGTAWEAASKIMTITDFIKKNDNQRFQDIVDRLFIALGEILYQATALILILSNYFDMNKIFEYFFASNILEKKNQELITKSIRFFKIILPYFEITSSQCEKTVQIMQKHCNFIKWTLQQSRRSQLSLPDLPLSTTLLYACEMTLEVLAFCDRVVNSPINLSTVSKRLCHCEVFIKELGKEVKNFLIESAIPNWHLLRDPVVVTSPYRTNLEPLVTTANALYGLGILNRKDQSDLVLNMTKSDCVSFMFKYTESTRGTLDLAALEIIRLLSKILTHWAAFEKKLIGQLVGEREDFDSYICGELIKALEANPPDQRSIAYHLLIYYESQHKSERWKCPFEVIVKTILETPIDMLSSNLPLVKVLWFFMSHLVESEGQRPHDASEAASKLFSIVETESVQNCFTGCPEIVAFTLLNPIAYTIKMKVLEMWIRKNTDMRPLKLNQTYRPLVSCLWKLLITVPDDLLGNIETAITSGLSLNVHFCEHFDGLLIENVPNILTRFDPAIETRFLMIIRLWSVRFNHLALPRDFAFTCAPNIVRIIVEHSNNQHIRRSMLRFLRDMLHHCREKSDVKAVKVFIRNFRMIRTLYAYLPSKVNDIHRFMDIFGSLLQFQKDNLDLQSTQSVIIENNQLIRDLMSYYRTMCNKALVFWTFLFSESIEKPIFKISECISENAVTPLVFYVFKETLVFQKQWGDQQRAMLYQCLLAIFEYCQRKKFTKLLNKLCDSPEIVHFIEDTLYSDGNNERFFQFVVKWLEISLSIPTKTCQRLMEPNDAIRDHWHVVSPLERIIMKLQRHSQRTLSEYSHVSPSIVGDLNIIIANFSFNSPTNVIIHRSLNGSDRISLAS